MLRKCTGNKLPVYVDFKQGNKEKYSALLLEKHHQTPYNTMITFCSKLYFQGKKSTQTIGLASGFVCGCFLCWALHSTPQHPTLMFTFCSWHYVFSHLQLFSPHPPWPAAHTGSKSTVCSHQRSPASTHGASSPPWSQAGVSHCVTLLHAGCNLMVCLRIGSP